MNRNAGLKPISDKKRAKLAATGITHPSTTFASPTKPAARRATKRPSTRTGRDVRSAEASEAVRRALAVAKSRGWRCAGDALPEWARRSPHFKRLPDEQRFALLCVRDVSGCWLWIGSVKRNGYGQFRFGRRNGYAHRASYKIYVGEIPDELAIDHLCGLKRCVNPAHLEAVTGSENTRRYAATIKQCPAGHPYTAENTVHRRNGGRTCRRCHNSKTSLNVSVRHTLAVASGGASPRVKLLDSDIAAMKKMRAAGTSVTKVAAKFGVTPKYASAVISGSRARRGRYTGPRRGAVLLVKRRSGDNCEYAGCAQPAGHVHHRRPRRMGSTARVETNLPANLLHLCAMHHDAVEANRLDALRNGLLLHDQDMPDAVPVRTQHGWVLLDNEGSWTRVEPPHDPMEAQIGAGREF